MSPARGRDRARLCARFIDALLGERPLDRLRSAQGVLRFAQRVGAARLEAACTRAASVDEYRYHTVKTILAARPRAAPRAHAGGRPHRALPVPRPSLDRLLPRPRGRKEVRMELTHQR